MKKPVPESESKFLNELPPNEELPPNDLPVKALEQWSLFLGTPENFIGVKVNGDIIINGTIKTEDLKNKTIKTPKKLSIDSMPRKIRI